MTLNDDQITRLSKRLSYHLRHRPDELGLTLGPGGWVAVDELLTALARKGKTISRAELEEVVARNTKRSFAFDETGARIRASQGHSVEIDLGLEPVEPPAELYHGTGEPTVRRRLAPSAPATGVPWSSSWTPRLYTRPAISSTARTTACGW